MRHYADLAERAQHDPKHMRGRDWHALDEYEKGLDGSGEPPT